MHRFDLKLQTGEFGKRKLKEFYVLFEHSKPNQQQKNEFPLADLND